MGRLANLSKMGYFPFDQVETQHVARMCKAPSGDARLLDPCAGNGGVLDYLSGKWEMKPYANELDEERYQNCLKRFGQDQAVNGDLFKLKVPNFAFQAIWHNPPYLPDKDERFESKSMRHNWLRLDKDGLFFHVVYAHNVQRSDLEWLASRSVGEIRVFRKEELDLGKYVQIVIVARKAVERHECDLEMVLELEESLHKDPDGIPLLKDAPDDEFQIPDIQTEPRRWYFAPSHVDAETMMAAIQDHGAHLNRSVQAIMRPKPEAPVFRPIVQPRSGQLGLILAGGALDGARVTIDEKEAIIRGAVRRVKELVDNQPLKKGKGHKEIYHYKPQTSIILLHQDGTLETVGTDGALVDFIRDHRATLLDYLNTVSTPLYDFKYGEISSVFGDIFKDRPLKGEKPGLLETQKHVAAAIYRALKVRNKGVLLAAEMGTGKTAMASTIIKAWWKNKHFKPGQFAVVMAPPIVATDEKWCREIRDVAPGTFVGIVANSEEARQFVKHVDEHPDQLHVMVVNREMAKLGEAWEPAYMIKHRFRKIRQVDRNNTQAIPEYKREHKEYLACPECGNVLRKRKVLDRSLYDENLKNPELEATEENIAWLGNQPRQCQHYDEYYDSDGKLIHKFCHAPLWQFSRSFSEADKPLRAYSEHHRDYASVFSYLDLVQKAARKGKQYDGSKHAPAKNPRMPLADYLRQRYSDRVALAIFDEVHELKGGDTAQGRAFQTLYRIADKAIGLTGTLYGGVASSLFWIEWAFNPRMYKNFPINRDGGPSKYAAQREWIELMGILEQEVEYREDKTNGAGKTTGIKRTEKQARERPGMSALLTREILDHAIFVKLTDLGFDMVSLDEHPVPLKMPKPYMDGYNNADDDARKHMLDLWKEGSKEAGTFLGSYLSSFLCAPNAHWKNEEVIHNRRDTGPKLVTVIPGSLGNKLSPKEEWLVETLNKELGEGRNVGIYVRQTLERDIQPRLVEIIEKHVPLAKPVILRSSAVSTKKRFNWLNQKVKEGYNILLTNPMNVAVGLDLVMFPTLVTYEPVYSLYTVLQSVARHWRLIQDKPCKTYFPFYQDTMEARAIALIAAKKNAANMLAGELGGDGLDALADGANSMLRELANQIKEETDVPGFEKILADFSTGVQVSSDSMWKTDKEPITEMISVKIEAPEPEEVVEPPEKVDIAEVKDESLKQMALF